MRRRTIKATSPQTLSQQLVREAIRGVHVRPLATEGWQVRTIGPRRIERIFAEKSQAVSYAETLALEPTRHVIVHREAGR
jgi:Uncharacterized protein conserved in bacteria (DUF2188)